MCRHFTRRSDFNETATGRQVYGQFSRDFSNKLLEKKVILFQLHNVLLTAKEKQQRLEIWPTITLNRFRCDEVHLQNSATEKLTAFLCGLNDCKLLAFSTSVLFGVNTLSLAIYL